MNSANLFFSGDCFIDLLVGHSINIDEQFQYFAYTEFLAVVTFPRPSQFVEEYFASATAGKIPNQRTTIIARLSYCARGAGEIMSWNRHTVLSYKDRFGTIRLYFMHVGHSAIFSIGLRVDAKN